MSGRIRTWGREPPDITAHIHEWGPHPDPDSDDEERLRKVKAERLQRCSACALRRAIGSALIPAGGTVPKVLVQWWPRPRGRSPLE